MDYLWRLLLISVLLAECFGDNQVVTQKPATMQITTTRQCVNCHTKTTTHKTTTHKTTTHSTLHTNHTTTAPTTTHTNHTTEPTTTAHTNHTTAPHTNHTTAPHTNHTTAPHTNHTTTPHTNHTTPHPTTALPPAPPEYSVNGTSGICLRIIANFRLTSNITKVLNYTIPPPPTTNHSGRCSADTAELVLTFPGGSLGLTFKEEKKNNTYYLSGVNVSGEAKGLSQSLTEMSTPLGKSFACEEVKLDMTNVTVTIMDVKAQAIELKGGNFGPEKNCAASPSRSKTVAIVVGVVLAVLIITVVAAYLIARALRHRSAGYQPL